MSFKIQGADITLQSTTIPPGFDTLSQVKLSLYYIPYPGQKAVMSPTQFGTHCVPNLKRPVKSPHIVHIPFIKTSTKFHSQISCQLFQKTLTIERSFISLAFI